VTEQWEQQFHSERNSNRLSTVGKSPRCHPVLTKSAIRHTQARIRREMSAELVGFLTQIDVIDKKAAPKWRAAGLMA